MKLDESIISQYNLDPYDKREPVTMLCSRTNLFWKNNVSFRDVYGTSFFYGINEHRRSVGATAGGFF